MGQNKKNLRTMLSYILLCMEVADSKWNDPTTTTGKKTFSY